MPNWTNTSYRIEGSNEALLKLFTIIDDFMTGRRKPSYCDEMDIPKNWEGNIIEAVSCMPFEDIKIQEPNKSTLRGFIQSYSMGNGFLSIEAEEAWSMTDFKALLEEFVPGLTAVYFSVEEPALEIYTTNDKSGKYFKRFLIDSYVNKVFRTKYFKDLNDALSFAAQLLGKKTITIDELDAWNTELLYSDEFVYVHEFEVVND